MRRAILFFLTALGLIFFHTPNGMAQKQQEEVLGTIKVELKSAKNLVQQFTEVSKKIQTYNLKNWAQYTPEQIREEYGRLDSDLVAGIKICSKLTNTSKNLARNAGELTPATQKKEQRNLYQQAKVSIATMQTNVDETRRIWGSNDLFKEYQNDIKKQNALFQKMEALQSEADNNADVVKNQVDTEGFADVGATMALLSTYSELQENQLSLVRNLMKIYSRVVAFQTGTKDEYRQAFGDPGEIDELAENLVGTGWSLKDFTNELFGLLESLQGATVTGLMDADIRGAFKRARKTLEEGKRPGRKLPQPVAKKILDSVEPGN
jgi:hypothetical protein